jgi:hypothetical protein
MSLFRPVHTAFSGILAVLKVQIARSTNNIGLLRLPPVKAGFASNSKIVNQEIVDFADGIFAFLVRKTSQPCLFRSYVRAVLLRHSGFPVDLNIGLRNMGSSAVYGHCWLTLDGVPYFEREDVEDTYPFFLGKTAAGIQYWAGSVDTENMIRIKREEYVND